VAEDGKRFFLPAVVSPRHVVLVVLQQNMWQTPAASTAAPVSLCALESALYIWLV
jgi:hypothetical protein